MIDYETLKIEKPDEEKIKIPDLYVTHWVGLESDWEDGSPIVCRTDFMTAEIGDVKLSSSKTYDKCNAVPAMKIEGEGKKKRVVGFGGKSGYEKLEERAQAKFIFLLKELLSDAKEHGIVFERICVIEEDLYKANKRRYFKVKVE